MLILGEKDPVLLYKDSLEQIENTRVQLVTLPDGHMSHIENKDELARVLLDFLNMSLRGVKQSH